MKLKTNEDGFAEVQDGKPVYVDDSGKEHTYDAPAMRKSFDKLNGELTELRQEKQKFESKLGAFEGIDPEKANEAIKTLKNLEDKKLVDAGEVDRIKQEVAQQYQKQLDETKSETQKLQQQYASEKISSAFGASKFVQDRLAIPPDMAQAAFGRHFEFNEGRITPKDANGNLIYSESNPGDVATFDEALERVVSQYPHRDKILRGTGNRGSGSEGVDGDTGARIVSRKHFESLSAGKQQEMARAASEGKVQIQE